MCQARRKKLSESGEGSKRENKHLAKHTLPGKKDLLLSSPINVMTWGGQKCGELRTPSFKHGKLFLPGSPQEGDNLQMLGAAEASSTKRDWRRE